ncbi:MAG: hypothetical protein HUU28_02920 [Planctomycetaceae bacterium]|nr:hypothetical protein [Planctomycetaceae bacterium]
MLRPLCTVFALAAFAPSSAADCVSVWPTGTYSFDTWGSSADILGGLVVREVCDDFDLNGRVTRIAMAGYNGSLGPDPAPVDGVWVRFYAWTPTGPGAQQAAFYIAGNDPRLRHAPRPDAVDVELPTAFLASGKHFVSMQVDFTDYAVWEPFRSNVNAPRLSTGWVRTNGGAWSTYSAIPNQVVSADVDFTLYADAAPVCADWQPMSASVVQGTANLTELDVLSATDVWAVGQRVVGSASNAQSVAYARHFDGAAWSLTNLPPAQSQMLALDAFSANDVWTAGSKLVVDSGGWPGGQVCVDHFDGTAWTVMSTPMPATPGYTGSEVLDIKALASNDVWFVGEWVGPYPGAAGYQAALAMHWDGSAFTLVPAPEVSTGGNGLEAIDGVAPNDLWAVGGSADGNMGPYSYILHWDGSAWSHVTAPLVGSEQRLRDVLAIAPNDVWAVGEAYTTNAIIGFLQHWDGVSWSNVTNVPPEITFNLHANGPNDLWLGLWHWNGSAWSHDTVVGCNPGKTLRAIDGAGGNLFAIGSEGLPEDLPFVAQRVSNCVNGTYCTSSYSSNGCTATIEGLGTASASASSGFTIRAHGLEGQRSCLIFYSLSGAQTLSWSTGSTSFLCVKLPTQRMNPASSGGSVGACNGVLAQDWNAFMASQPGALGTPRVAGQHFGAQVWFRDPPAPKSTNLSNALAFTLQP